MTDWILTLGLQNLRRQINEAFPNRDHESDGTIGDAAHAAESSSGHNPDDTAGSHAEWNGDPDSTPEVRAWDMDSDLRTPGVTAQQVVDHIRHLPGVSSVLRYIIYNRKIYKASSGWTAEDYTGASAHTEHIHFTGAWTQAADNNQSFDYRLEEFGVALDQSDIDKITAAVAPAVWKYKLANAYSGTDMPAGDILRYVPSAQRTIDLQAQVAQLAGVLNGFVSSEATDDASKAQAIQAVHAAVDAIADLPQAGGAVSQDQVNTAVTKAFHDAFSAA